MIFQLGGDSNLSGGNGDDQLTNWNWDGDDAVFMSGNRGDDILDNQDLTGTTEMDGGRGTDECIDGTIEENCEI